MSENTVDTGSPFTEAGPPPFTEQTVRDWRFEIDGLIDAVKFELSPSREVSLCHTSLQKAKAWLGETLKAIGTANPYPNSSDPTNKTIEPQAEHGDQTRVVLTQYPTQLERVKAMRSTIQGRIDSLQSRPYGMGYIEKETATKNLIEAKHWLGWELDRIKTEQEVDNGSMDTISPNRPASLY